MELGPPDVMERKGALTLRSSCAYYGRPTLVYRWYNNREAEPKDYDIHEISLGSKNLCRSTYWRLGTEDEKWITTSQDHLSQPYRIKEYQELEIRKPLLDEDAFELGVTDRDTGLPEADFGAVLPRHSPDHFKMFLDTTYRMDYVPPYDYAPYVVPAVGGYSVVHRKCHSQFTDTADYRRHGINTWQDESGVYANTDLKQKVFPVTNPIRTNVNEDYPEAQATLQK
ncbi:cilia- and flagella-associated protein 95 isoform X4 [Rhineura floridana]|uniref:cilia- and flagella-associated protein 95 isoform X4 n=1 Tax=Rhineura floridana TaxID=261503 RepID=UPI002AC83936|nr:cilia- and flagella-associated protein 95 isoform X4 [Rhineura floridana]